MMPVPTTRRRPPEDTLEYHEYTEAQSTSYRGFSTSIAGSFRSLQEERVDACAMVCCGVMQSDRDRFLLTGVRPPTCFRRITTHIILPVSFFMLATFAAISIKDAVMNQLVCTTLILATVFMLILQCCKGRWKRMKVRKELLWRKHHMSKGDYGQRMLLHIEEDNDDESVEDSTYLNGQSKWDLSCAHSLLGCYTTDVPSPSERPNNLCGCLWDALMKACCGACCGCHLQVCGMCALAQEGREVERLIGIPSLDYLTYQPVLDYAPSIWNSRAQEGNAPWYLHFSALSILSKESLRNFGLTVLGLTLLWPGKRGEHLVVVLATFAHALIFLALVYWPYHRTDVSVDALLKYFLSGFLLSTTLAITWELVLALLLRAFMSVVFALSGIDVAFDTDGYQGMIGFGTASLNYHDYLQAFADEHPIFHTIYLLVNTYCVAALVEEVCKYFGYRMVDHIDVWSNEDVQKAVAVGIPEGFVEHEAARQSARTGEQQSETAPADPQVEAPKRTLKSIGAATTVSMVAVALGFACCENLVYIFLYNHDHNLAAKLGILLTRALLPIHPIVAAVQSIGMCRRDLEKESSHQLGRIIFPAVMIHGTFDFVLIFLDFLGGENVTTIWVIMEWMLAELIVVASIVYYYKESMAQRERLEQLDLANNVDQSSLL